MRAFLTPGLAVALAGCISFGADPPPSLLNLTSAATIAPATSRVATPADALAVAPLTVPQELRTARVPVRTGGTQVAYVKDAQWVEPPATLFGRLIGETIAARTGRVVVDPAQLAFDPGLSLSGQLNAFGIDAATLEAEIVYDAVLSREAGRIETRRFTGRAPVAAIDPINAGTALNQAANQVATQVADWVGRAG